MPCKKSGNVVNFLRCGVKAIFMPHFGFTLPLDKRFNPYERLKLNFFKENGFGKISLAHV